MLVSSSALISTDNTRTWITGATIFRPTHPPANIYLPGATFSSIAARCLSICLRNSPICSTAFEFSMWLRYQQIGLGLGHLHH